MSDQGTPYAHTPGGMSSTNEAFPSIDSAGWPREFQAPPQNGDVDSYRNVPFCDGVPSPPMMRGGPFQQPLLPQDLFGLPATLDWNWAEMSGGAYPSVENGNFGGDGPSSMQS
ncbi:hypothetical protein CDD83_3102 [Cordyceps sp. RAO-2017]|nr:hypothetical protein CDD83_3102 [Cordyceps sp. RAO-2017]